MFNSTACGEENSCANTMRGMRKPQRPLTPDEKTDADRFSAIWLRKKKDLGLTQEQAAAECGWTQGMFWQYLSGHRALNLEAVLKIARVLQVKPDEISPRLMILLTDEAHRVNAIEPKAGYNKDLHEWMRLGQRCIKLGLTGTARRTVENIVEAVLIERGVAEGNATARKDTAPCAKNQRSSSRNRTKKIAR